MALEGNLKDFGLDAVFQLIANNRNTGVLTLSAQGQQVKVSFIQGQVVWADTQPRKVEDRLGFVLVRSGKISPERLQEALNLQKQTLQQLGVVLVQHRLVDSEDLRAALRTQVLQIVYRLFKWREGDFKFLQEEEIDYDKENFAPIRSDHILMEGMRMLDEWPQIEKRIPSFKKIFMKAPDEDDPLGLGVEAKLGAPKLGGGGFDFSDLAEEKPAGKLKLSREEALVHERVDGTNTVQDIMDRVPLTEFEVCRALVDMLDRGIIEEKPDAMTPSAGLAREKARQAETSPLLIRIAVVLGVAGILASFVTSHQNPVNTLYFAERYQSIFHEARYGASRNRIEKIDWALKTFYMSYQRFPEELKYLYDRGLVPRESLLDPWGRSYEYTLMEDAYLVLGKNEAGDLDPSLRVYYEFGGAGAGFGEAPPDMPAAAPEPDEEPQVITLPAH